LKENSEDFEFVIEKVELAIQTQEPILQKSIKLVSPNSGYKQVTISPFCECGKRIVKENALRCSTCGKLLCRECGIEYMKNIHCKSCLKEKYGIFLTKTDYIILLCIFRGIDKPRHIFELTGIDPDVIADRLKKLLCSYLTDKPNRFKEKIFPKLRMTRIGLDTFMIYDKQIFAQDEQIRHLKQKITEFLEKRRKPKYKLRTQGARRSCQSRDC